MEKRPSRIIDIQDRRFQTKEKKSTNYSYGKLVYGEHENTTKKLSLRTFFGNPQSEVFCIKFDETDQVLASGNSDGSIKIFSLESGKLLWNLQGSTGAHQTPTTSVAWKPGQQSKLLYSVNADGSIIIWSTASGKFLEKVVEEEQIFTMDFNQDGTKFATGGKDFHVRVYDNETLKIETDFIPQEYEQLGHSNRIFASKFLKEEPNILLTGGWDSTILIWDVREKQAVGEISGPNLSGQSLDYKNGQILTGSYRNYDQLQLFDLKQRKKVRDIPWNGKEKSDKVYCYCSQFSKLGPNTILSGCTGDNSVKIFDQDKEFSQAASIIQMKEGIYTCDFANTNNKFAFGGGEGVVYIMSLNDTSDN